MDNYRDSRLLLKGLFQFGDFFSDQVKFNSNSRKFKKIPWNGNKTTIGNYLQFRNLEESKYNSFEVMPSDKLVRLIKETMIPIEYDEIAFEIIIYNDKTAMLIARYNQIIGSRWIAMIDLKSIPDL